jgi:CheY-like chemotaxis protein
MALRILVVDDKEDILDLLNKVLELRLDAEVVPVSCGKKAIELITSAVERFDFILCDLYMPVVNGVDVFEAYKKAGHPGMFALTTNAPESQIPKLDAPGYIGCIQKVYHEEIIRKIQQCI